MLKYVIVLGMAVVCVEMRFYSLKMFSSDDPDTGHLKNCASAVKNFTVSWKPKKLVPHGRISADLEFIPPYDWVEGEATVTVYLKSVPKTPIIQYEKTLSCDILKEFAPSTSCPFKAGKPVHIQYADKLPSLPAGEYLIKGSVMNTKNQEILCATGEIDVST